MLYAPELRNMPPDFWPIITKTAPLYVSQTDLELLVYPRLVLNSQSSCLSLSGSGLHMSALTSLASLWHWTQKISRGLEWQLRESEHLSCKHEDLSLDPRYHT